MPVQLRTILVPPLVRIKPRALERLPVYLQRLGYRNVLALISDGLPTAIQIFLPACKFTKIIPVEEASIEWLEALSFKSTPYDAICGIGGGKALDVAKLLAFRLELPYLTVPTSLSNDGFCSPQSSLTLRGKKASFPARLPMGVVIDLLIVQGAPHELWLSGIGDLVSKRTAIKDWKIAFHTAGTPFDDLAALLSDATVFQFMAHPQKDMEGTRLLAQALLLNGVAMEIAGSSRPASGSEHLISHALDQLAKEPRGHGLQVGFATYWMALVQQQSVLDIDRLFTKTGFWRYWQEHPWPQKLWREALDLAPTIKPHFTTILNSSGTHQLAQKILKSDSKLQSCLT